MVDDAEADWLHPANSFDLIHTRHTIQAFRNWPQIFEKAFTYVSYLLFSFRDFPLQTLSLTPVLDTSNQELG